MFSTLFGPLTKSKRRSRSRGFVPRLEVLEGRTLPSTFTVVNLADSGAGSLRAEIAAAEANPGPDLINFAPAVMGTITLTSELSITQDLTIDGPRAENITISGGGQTRVFSISGATTHVAIDDLTIADGRVQDDTRFGAGLLNRAANVSLARVVFTNNQAVGSTDSVAGGAIANLFGASLTVHHASFRGNVAVQGVLIQHTLNEVEGGAILCDAGSSAVIQDSTFIANQATGGKGSAGGAIGALGGSRVTLLNCVFDNNLAQGGPGILADGGAIDTKDFGFFSVSPATLIVAECSFTGNRAISGNAGGPFSFSEAFGGAIAVGGGSAATVSHSTFQGNRARGGDDSFFAVAFGGAIFNGSATLTVRSSTFIDNEARGGTSGNGAPGISADPGWDGIGGAIAASIASINPITDVADCVLVGNRAVGGDGGPGGSGGNGGRGGPGRGGAIANLFGTLTLTHSVLAGNEALGGAGGAAGSGAGTLGGDGGVGRGGGLNNDRGAIANVSQVLIAGNQAIGGRGIQGGNGGDGLGGGIFTGRSLFTTAALTLADSIIWNNQATGGEGIVGGNGLGGGVFNGNTGPGSVPILTVTNSLVTGNQATGGKGSAGGSDGQGIGGGVYNIGTFFLDALTIIRFNHASTSDNDIFGPFVVI